MCLANVREADIASVLRLAGKLFLIVRRCNVTVSSVGDVGGCGFSVRNTE